jgi:hypothetical protein
VEITEDVDTSVICVCRQLFSELKVGKTAKTEPKHSDAASVQPDAAQTLKQLSVCVVSSSAVSAKEVDVVSR